jgi:hypothetical protein
MEKLSFHGTMRPMDECLDELIAKLAVTSGLESESVQGFMQVPQLLEKLGCEHDRIDYHGGRDVPIANAVAYSETVDFGGSEELVKPEPAPLDAAQAAFAQQIRPRFKDIHIICELGPKNEGHVSAVFLHAYTRSASDSLNQPNLVALIHTCCEPALVGSLPTRFPSNAWCWLIADEILGGDAAIEWQGRNLGRSGPVFGVRIRPDWTQPRSAAMRYRVPADPLSTGFSGDPAEPALELAVYEQENDYTVVELLAKHVSPSKTMPSAPFDLACLSNSLKYGYWRGMQSLLAKDANHE